MASETFFNRIRAAQTEPVRGEVRSNPAVLQLTNPSGFTALEFAIDLLANKRGSSVEMVRAFFCACQPRADGAAPPV